MEVRPVDRRVYLEELRSWLPARIIDIHVHVALAQHIGYISEERKKANWAYEVGLDQSWEDLWKSLEILFPEQQVDVVVFGVPLREVDLEANNAYIRSGLQNFKGSARGLLVTKPEWQSSVIETALKDGFIGIKPYPDLAPSENAEPTVFDFAPRSHLEVLDRLGGILMLHLPGKGRLADPNNIQAIKEISRGYKSIKIVIAHVGRSFCLPTAQRGLPSLVGLPNVWYDISAVMNADVIEYAVQSVGADRVLYGSDLPITLIHGYREHVGDTYINYTDGDYSWNTNRKPPEIEANYTYYLYEELRALIEAARRLGDARAVIRRIMLDNAIELLEWG